ncbi:phage tail sheath subtilisin-like domain-containing protein [Endozoicomonas sp. SM1973]|uniref:Phage tail sheath subtilisin-like domain-containing protein n=1 Tax=Spartinivicinus marinus TaxID=2994442 RepID=A0A853IAJ1_9GAMM|nr:phage tail sheath subtilisin-like domain-containing protein [Spartinivicinus marinus]MCX4026612.1 phage tail sheath subtilisin-like domain-containing protein [Spartinivicinus marinus]NYZ64446.1 phage tail sheath subtilisin-like domain-containing protein [Spartinivicinus marinus]
MSENFLHGIEIIEDKSGPRPIRTVRSSVIGVIGTAPEAKEEDFPYHKPVLIAGKLTEAAGLGKTGTLPDAIKGIFDQAGAAVVVVRVPEQAEADAQKAEFLKDMSDDGVHYQGIMTMVSAESVLGVTPRILIAPKFSQQFDVADKLKVVAERLRAIAIVDGPNTNDAEAKQYAEKVSSERVYMVDPFVKVFNADTKAYEEQPMSPRAAGVIARTDNDSGFWWSPSNQQINGINNLARAVDFTLGDTNCRANLLNEKHVTTVIRKDGFRLWGNHTTGREEKWRFLSVRRTADMINESLLRAHMWAVDQNITTLYLEHVSEGVNNYLRDLQAKGAIIGGRCYPDPELNSPDSIQNGKVYFNVEFTPPYPAEHITFTSRLTNEYLEELV